MKRFLYLVTLIGIFFLVACSNDKNIVVSSTKGEVSPSNLVFVEFHPTKIDSNNLNILKDAKDIATLNGSAFKGKYVFKNSSLLQFIPDEAYLPKTSYVLKINLKTLGNQNGISFNQDSFKMEFSTNALKLDPFKLNFVSNRDNTGAKLTGVIETSDDIPINLLKEGVSLVDENGNSIGLQISKFSNSKREFSLESNQINISKDKNKEFKLKFNSKILKMENNKEFLVVLLKRSEFAFISMSVKNTDSKPNIEIGFSQNILKNNNIKDYITISPSIDFEASVVGNKIIITGNFDYSTTYSTTVLAGLKSEENKILKDPQTRQITISLFPPSIAFSGSGVFLPRSANKKIAFKTLNITKVHLKLQRIYVNNITQFLYDNSLFGDTQTSYYNNNIYNYTYKIADTILEQDFDIDSQKNIWVQNEVDLGKLSDLSGIFVIELSFNKKDVDYTFPKSMEEWRIDNFFYKKGNINKNLIFSNIALIAQSGAKKFTLNALDISNNSPMQGVQISAISPKNQTIEKLTTNVNGLAIFENANPSNTLYFLAQKDKDMSVLRLVGSELSNDGYDTEGLRSNGDIKAFIYTDRGVYRPGDEIYMNIIARNDGKVLSNHPIYLTLFSPRGKKILNKRVIENVLDGNYFYKISTPKNADTGVWQAKIEIGGSVFYKDLSVEAVVPNRIKVDIKAEDILELSQDDELPFALQSDYLFGAPASNLDYSAQVTITPKKFTSKIYRDYIFSSPISINYYKSDYLNGKLDDKGYVKNRFSLGGVDRVNANLVANILAKVTENGGRQVSFRKNILLKQYNSFVGLKVPSSNYINTKEKLNIPVIVRDFDDKNLVADHLLHYKIYRNNYYWWWDYDSYDSYIRSIKTDKNTQIVAEGDLISSNKPINLTYEANDRGEMFIEVKDTTNGSTSGIFIYASNWGDPLDNKKITSLKIKTDKESYLPGDTATINFESNKKSKALITINKEGKVLKRYFQDTDDKQTKIKVPITEDMSPNAYVTVLLLQDYLSTQNDRALRLYGVVPLNVVDPSTKLNIQIDAPDKILPGDDFEILVSNTDKKKINFTLAIVDEGLLDLNAFKTPDPWKYFYAKLGLELQTFDTYNDIIGHVFGKIQKVLVAGGDEENLDNKQKSDENAERFRPVVFYVPPMQTDKNGQAKLKFTMPTYMGSIRVMAVATSGNSYANAQKYIKVSAPVVMIPTIPRSLKVGDKFKLAVELFPTEDDIKSASISIETKKGIVKFANPKIETKFNDKKSQIVNFEGIVGDEIGVEDINLHLESKDFKLNDSLQIDVKAINPYITDAQEHIIRPNETWNIKVPTDFVKGSNSGHIVLSSTPLLSLDNRISWLIHYPYGCIEQITSSVFPQLFLSKLSDIGITDKQEIIENINTAIRNMQGFQTVDGGFSYWQGRSRSDMWGSNYAGHFLIIAKQMGYYVPEAMLSAWRAYEISLAKSSATLGIRIYSLYLLALEGNAKIGMMNQIYENNLSSLSNVEKWLLGATYQIAGYGDIAKKITKNLSVIPNSKDDYYKYSYGSKLRDKAIILQAYNVIYNKTEENLFRDLKDALQSKDWLSTQTIAYSLLSIANLKSKNDNVPILGSIDINGKKIEFSDTSTNKAIFDFSQGKAKISSAMPTDLHASYVYSGIYIKSKLPTIAKKIALKREFLNEYGHVMNPDRIKSGTTFYLKITLSNVSNSLSNISNMALMQGLPSGWEIENTRLNNDNLPSFIDKSQISKVIYTDIRDDKIMWFFDYYGYYKNEVQIVYVKLNAVTPGTYTLPSAYAEAMYDNSFEARTESMQVEVLSE